jgi:hypothetical protein
MKSPAYSELGQALVIIVLVIFVLLGITGLFSDRGNCCMGPYRRPQNVADKAALAAAVSRLHGDNAWVQSAYKMAGTDGYVNDGVSSQVEVYTCDMAQASCGSHAGNPDYIQVVITAYQEMFFSKVIGVRQRERVESIAFAQLPDKVGLWRSDSPIPGRGPNWEFFVPPWLQFILEPYRLVLIILICAVILGLLLLIRRVRVKPA